MKPTKEEKQKANQKGHKGERLAALYLRLKGYQILKRRYKMRVGEADIVAWKGNVVVFVEVKARPTLQEGLEAITDHQKKRIINAAKYFMLTTRLVLDLDFRFDVIVVLPWYRLRHVENAWSL